MDSGPGIAEDLALGESANDSPAKDGSVCVAIMLSGALREQFPGQARQREFGDVEMPPHVTVLYQPDPTASDVSPGCCGATAETVADGPGPMLWPSASRSGVPCASA